MSTFQQQGLISLVTCSLLIGRRVIQIGAGARRQKAEDKSQRPGVSIRESLRSVWSGRQQETCVIASEARQSLLVGGLAETRMRLREQDDYPDPVM